MENKKLVKILLKDMSELEELISEVKEKGNFDSLEMEFIHTKAKGLMQLLHLLDNKEVVSRTEISQPLKTGELREKDFREGEADRHEVYDNKQDSSQEKQKFIHEEQLDTADKQSSLQDRAEWADDKQLNEANKQEKRLEQKESPSASEKMPSGIDKEDKENEDKEAHTDGKEQQDVQGKGKEKEQDDDDEMLMEESDKPETSGRLGDSFLKGKSVNDLITDQHKLEFKLSNRPVSSIRAAIGINDRFQYIRELFDNDVRKFLNTVDTLDSMGNIKEAVDYIRQNFKWEKTETSLKFVNLVKRRFQKSADNY
jgi:hypothetical protein